MTFHSTLTFTPLDKKGETEAFLHDKKVSLIKQMAVDYMVVRLYSVGLKTLPGGCMKQGMCVNLEMFFGGGMGLEETEWNPIWYYEQA